MSRNQWIAIGSLCVLLTPSAATAQQPGPPAPSPRLLVAMPPGGQAGTTVEVIINGQDLEGALGLYFSHPGITATMLPAPPPPPRDPKKPKGKVNQPAAVRFEVTIARDTPLGHHDLRIITTKGVSNPRAFVVGDLQEVMEKEPNNDVAEAQRVAINTTINGTISTPTDVDYFVFAGKRKQKVVVSCLSTSIDGRLQADLQLFRGKQLLASNRSYRGGDAVLDATLPEDGDYHVRLCSFAYAQGNAEHFYRLTITTAPWIDAVYPPVVEPGKANKVTLYGRNLPNGKPDPSALLDNKMLEKAPATIDNLPTSIAGDSSASNLLLQRLIYSGFIPAKATGLDGIEYRVRHDLGVSSPYLLTYAQHPLTLDNEANSTPETAQAITLPCEVVGRIEKKRARHWYQFKARKGEIYGIELFGDRLGSPIDPYFVLRSASNKQVIAESADNQESLHPFQFFTRSEDPSRYRFVAPADGEYQLRVGTRQAEAQAGPRDIYKVRIAPEQPDFRLVVMPSSTFTPAGCVVGQGGHQAYTVFVWRLDGYQGEITLSADGLPEGVACQPQIIGPGVSQATFVISAADDAPPWTGEIKVKGTATINGQEVIREARSATITWPAQQNNPTISRLDRSLVLAVRDKPPFTLTAGIDKVTAKPGGQVTVPLKVERHAAESKAPLQVSTLNLSSKSRRRSTPALTLKPDENTGNVVVDIRPDMPAGTYSIVLQGQMQIPGTKGKQKQNYTLTMPSQPITLTVEPKQPPAGKEKKGASGK